MSDATRQARGQAAWRLGAQSRGLRTRLLWPVSLLYRALVALRRTLYARGVLTVHRLPVPVIVVGNVVVGGAGKTPCTIALVQHLRAQGWTPGVVSRGHGRREAGVQAVRAESSAAETGDEPLLIRQRTGVPVFVAAQRAEAAQALLAAHPDVNVLVCDDGLQHLALGRDIAVAVFDDRGSGNGWLLPAGLLREPWPPARRTAFQPDIVLCQAREGQPAAVLAPSPMAAQFQAARRLASEAVGPLGQRLPMGDLRGQPVTALAAIARPEVFFDMLRAQGLDLAHTIALPDHADAAAYTALLETTLPLPLLCTEKDAVKLFPLLTSAADGQPVPAWAVPLELAPDPAFFAAIDARLAALKPGA